MTGKYYINSHIQGNSVMHGPFESEDTAKEEAAKLVASGFTPEVMVFRCIAVAEADISVNWRKWK